MQSRQQAVLLGTESGRRLWPWTTKYLHFNSVLYNSFLLTMMSPVIF